MALDLAHKNRATRDAMAAGRLNTAQAEVLLRACRDLDLPAARSVEAVLLPTASHTHAPAWRRAVQREAIRADARSAHERHERARQDRRVVVRPAENGMAELWALLPAEAALAISTALDARARTMKSAGDERTLDQLRADTLGDAFNGAGLPTVDGEHTSGGGRRANLNVTMSITTLLGFDDAPADLAGYGAITAEVAREIATDATWRRLLTDPVTGAVVQVGERSYKPGAVIQRHVQARDGSCRFPGCNRSAETADIDHTVPYPKGNTEPSNLGVLCRRHHRYKHDGGFPSRLRQTSSGVFEWCHPTTRVDLVTPPNRNLSVAADDSAPTSDDAPGARGEASSRELLHFLVDYWMRRERDGRAA
jgi:hypothetical protein